VGRSSNLSVSEGNIRDGASNLSAVIRAVIFNIGGVPEVTPQTGHRKRREAKLGLAPGELDRTLADV